LLLKTIKQISIVTVYVWLCWEVYYCEYLHLLTSFCMIGMKEFMP